MPPTLRYGVQSRCARLSNRRVLIGDPSAPDTTKPAGASRDLTSDHRGIDAKTLGRFLAPAGRLRCAAASNLAARDCRTEGFSSAVPLRQTRQSPLGRALSCLAEREGFEPSEGINLRRFSRPVQSTALPPLRWRRIVTEWGAPGSVALLRRLLPGRDRYDLFTHPPLLPSDRQKHAISRVSVEFWWISPIMPT